MKKLIVLMAAIAFGINVTARDSQGAKTTKANSQAEQKKDATFAGMKDGKVWLSKDGKTTLLDKEVTLGKTVIKPNGTVILKDGKTAQLKNGDRVDAEGVLITSVKNPENKPEYNK